MAYVHVELVELVQHDQRLGSDDDFMMSTVRFILRVDGINRGTHEVAIKQSAGGSSEDPIEVLPFEGYRGPLDYAAFRAGIERYYRGLIGPAGRAIALPPNASLENVRVGIGGSFDFTADDASSGAW